MLCLIVLRLIADYSTLQFNRRPCRKRAPKRKSPNRAIAVAIVVDSSLIAKTTQLECPIQLPTLWDTLTSSFCAYRILGTNKYEFANTTFHFHRSFSSRFLLRSMIASYPRLGKNKLEYLSESSLWPTEKLCENNKHNKASTRRCHANALHHSPIHLLRRRSFILGPSILAKGKQNYFHLG